MRRAPVAGLVPTLFLGACVFGGEATPTAAPACPTEPPTSTSAQSTTEGVTGATLRIGGAVEGEITLELYPDAAPITTASFVSLARCGFYDGIWFHRVLAGFVIQAGDPQTKTRTGDFDGVGRGGPGYAFEIEPPADGLAYGPYSLSMANDTRANGSQFFIALTDLDEHLRSVGTYTIFGQVTEGTDVVDAIAAIPVNDPRVGVPLSLAVIESITILTGDDAER
jgi:dolichyl-diphosphooligosaccharide---protein glycosyltransferase